MPLLIPHLRRWFAGLAIALILAVAGVYFYARHRVQNALKQVPEKIGIEIQQTAKGFTISKSFEGHTLFKIEAGKLVQFKAGGKGELHDVEITVYGRDSDRFDRIAGKDFLYDAQTGDITGKGEVQIDLESNPSGGHSPDQSIPHGLKSPIHLKTTDLTFNQKTGDAHADGEVDFSVPQVSGSAIGLSYVAKSSLLTLNSNVVVNLSGIVPVSIKADRLALSRIPRLVILDRPQVTQGLEHSSAGKVTVFLSKDNDVQRILGEENVLIKSDTPDGGTITASNVELEPGPEDTLRRATLTGNVHLQSNAQGGMDAKAGRAVLNFTNSLIKDVHADQGVTLLQAGNAQGEKQRVEVTAPSMDISVAKGRTISNAETSGPPRIAISSVGENSTGDSTLITAGKFKANFDGEGKFAALRGAPDARIVSKSPGKPDRVSTSESIDAEFERGEISDLVQKGDFRYDDGQIKASADSARYSPRDQTLFLDGSALIQDKEMTTTARTIKLNRLTGAADADGDVKTTDISLSLQKKPGSVSSPLHVTAERMRATNNPARAVYTGNVRIWQNANSVEAPSVQFDRDRRTVTAEQIAGKRVSTLLNQSDAHGKITPITITADHLGYSQDEGTVHFDGGVMASGGDMVMAAGKMDCFLRGHSQTTENKTIILGGQVDKVIASGNVVVTEPGRRVTGNKLVYTAADDKYVMTGGPPSIFDAEHGKVTGVSLTLFGHDARVLVEGNDLSPAVTEIRVAR